VENGKLVHRMDILSKDRTVLNGIHRGEGKGCLYLGVRTIQGSADFKISVEVVTDKAYTGQAYKNTDRIVRRLDKLVGEHSVGELVEQFGEINKFAEKEVDRDLKEEERARMEEEKKMELRKSGLMDAHGHLKGEGGDSAAAAAAEEEDSEEEMDDEYMQELKDVCLGNLMQMYEDGVKVKVIPVPDAGADGYVDIQKKTMLKMLRSKRGLTMSNLSKSAKGIVDEVEEEGGGADGVESIGNIVNGKHLMHDIDMFSFDELMHMAKKKTGPRKKEEEKRRLAEEQKRKLRGEVQVEVGGEEKKDGEGGGVEASASMASGEYVYMESPSIESSMSSVRGGLVGGMTQRLGGREADVGVGNMQQTFRVFKPEEGVRPLTTGGIGGGMREFPGRTGSRGALRSKKVVKDATLRQLDSVDLTPIRYGLTKQKGIEKAYKKN
jgi:hypothetical protein